MGDPKGYLEMKVEAGAAVFFYAQSCGEEIENGEFKGKTLEVPEVRALLASV